MAETVQWLEVLWKPLVEIGIFWFAYYLLFVYIKDSGMAQALKGLVTLVILFFIAQVLDLKAIRWVLFHLFQISIIGFLIVFHPELRRGLTRIGQSPLFRFFMKEQRVIDELIKAVTTMSKNRIGALIAIEREVSLKPYIETGMTLDGVLTSELLLTIFMPNTPFHDGAVVVQGGRVVAAACLFPLSQSQKLSKTFGTRHRAALGLSEETDALVLVVSEETGIVTLMTQGKISRDLNEEHLRSALVEFYEPPRRREHRRFRFRSAARESS
jgi:diadenylate cyclase